MRRFLADAILILILVAIGSYMIESKPKQDSVELKDKMNEFEKEVADQKKVEPKVDEVHLNEVDENAASKFAQKTSDFIVDVADTSATIVAEIFHGLTR